MPVLVDTVLAGTRPTEIGIQGKVDRCSNGVLWAAYVDNTSSAAVDTFVFSYSTDNGATWTDAGTPVTAQGTGSSTTPNCSFFIDEDDYAHIIYRDRQTFRPYYRRGTPNAGRTAWAWSQAYQLSTLTIRWGDVIAHREGTGWVAHCVHGNFASTANIQYNKVTIDSDQNITVSADSTIATHAMSNSYPLLPTIDFHHDGGGKSVAGGTPHIYIGYSAGNHGVKIIKGTYDAGNWTFSAVTTVAADYRLGQSTDQYICKCLYDGTRIVIAGYLVEQILLVERFVIFDVDKDTLSPSINILETSPPTANAVVSGSVARDAEDNIYFAGTDAQPNRNIIYRKWTRSGNSFGSPVSIAAANGNSVPHVSLKRDYSGSRIELLYADNSSPRKVYYDSIVLNQTPNTPTNLQVTSVVTDTTPVFSSDISDPDSGQQIKGRFQIYQSDGVTLVGTVDSEFRTGAGTVTAEYASALPVGSYKVQAATVDDIGAISAYTAQVAFDVKVTVTDDLQLIWNVDALILDSLQLIWDVAEGNQKNLGLLWNVKISANKDFSILWNNYPIWTELDPDPEAPVDWEAVLP